MIINLSLKLPKLSMNSSLPSITPNYENQNNATFALKIWEESLKILNIRNISDLIIKQYIKVKTDSQNLTSRSKITKQNSELHFNITK